MKSRTLAVKPLTLAIALSLSQSVIAVDVNNNRTLTDRDDPNENYVLIPSTSDLTFNTGDQQISTDNTAIGINLSGSLSNGNTTRINITEGSSVTSGNRNSVIRSFNGNSALTGSIIINNAGFIGNSDNIATAAISFAASSHDDFTNIVINTGTINGPGCLTTNCTAIQNLTSAALAFTQEGESARTLGTINGIRFTSGEQVNLREGFYHGSINNIENILLSDTGRTLAIAGLTFISGGINTSFRAEGNVTVNGKLILLANDTANNIASGHLILSGNTSFSAQAGSVLEFQLSPDDTAGPRIQVTGSSLTVDPNATIRLTPRAADLITGIQNREYILFRTTGGATLSLPGDDRFEVSPLFTEALQIDRSDANQLSVSFDGPVNSGSGVQQLQNFANTGGASANDVVALGNAGTLSQQIIRKNGANVSQAEADFAALIALATNSASASNLARELQAQTSSMNLLAASNSQQTAIRNAAWRLQGLRIANNNSIENLMFAALENNATTLTDAAVGTPVHTKYGLWAKTVYVDSDQDNTGTVLGYGARSAGLALGYDQKVSPEILLGAALTFGKTDADIKNSADTSEIDTYQLTAYGSYDTLLPSGQRWLTDATLNIGFNEHESERFLDGFSPVAHRSEFDSEQLALQVLSSVEFIQNEWSIAPTFGFNYSKTELDAYSEVGGPAPLNVAAQDIEQLELGLGVNLSRSFETQAGTVQPYFGVMAWYDFNDDPVSSRAAFQLGGSSFTSTNISEDRDRYQVTMGANLNLDNDLKLGVALEHNHEDNLVSNLVSMALRYEF